MASRDYRRAADNPVVVQEVAAVLRNAWDPDRALLRGAIGAADFYSMHALALTAMVAAGAEQPEVARYLRQVEQGLLGDSLHAFKSRYAVSTAVWRTVHGPTVGEKATQRSLHLPERAASGCAPVAGYQIRFSGARPTGALQVNYRR